MDSRSIPPPVEGVKPILRLTPAVAARTVGACAMSAAGIYYIDRGKKDQRLEPMLLGAVLILASLFLFF